MDLLSENHNAVKKMLNYQLIPKIFASKHCLSDLSLKLNNLNPEADDVNTLSDEFVKILMILLIRMLHIAMHLEKNNAPLTNHGSPKAF